MGYGKTQKDGFRTSGKGLVSPLSLSLSLSLSSFEIIQRVVLLIPSPIKELSTVCIMLRHSGFMILRFGTSLDVEHTMWTIKVDDGVTVVVVFVVIAVRSLRRSLFVAVAVAVDVR